MTEPSDAPCIPPHLGLGGDKAHQGDNFALKLLHLAVTIIAVCNKSTKAIR